MAIRQIDYTPTKIRHIDWGWCRQIDRNFRFAKLTSAHCSLLRSVDRGKEAAMFTGPPPSATADRTKQQSLAPPSTFQLHQQESCFGEAPDSGVGKREAQRLFLPSLELQQLLHTAVHSRSHRPNSSFQHARAAGKDTLFPPAHSSTSGKTDNYFANVSHFLDFWESAVWTRSCRLWK